MPMMSGGAGEVRSSRHETGSCRILDVSPGCCRRCSSSACCSAKSWSESSVTPFLVGMVDMAYAICSMGSDGEGIIGCSAGTVSMPVYTSCSDAKGVSSCSWIGGTTVFDTCDSGSTSGLSTDPVRDAHCTSCSVLHGASEDDSVGFVDNKSDAGSV